MIITISQALRHPLFTVVKRDDTAGIVQLTCGEIPTVITIKINKLENRPGYSLDASHGIKAPETTVYFVRYREYPSPGAALKYFQHVFALTYSEAVSKAHQPSAQWLVSDRGSGVFGVSVANDGPTALPAPEPFQNASKGADKVNVNDPAL